MPSVTLDRIGIAIIRELQLNARISFSELGRRVNLTSPAVAERVRRLEDAEVIRGYHAHVSAPALGLQVEAIVRIAVAHTVTPERFARIAQRMPEVVDCYRVTGVDSFVLRVLTPSLDHLNDFLAKLTSYGQAVASIVLSQPISRRGIGVTEHGQEEALAG
jgi:Lrp/AsnC family transcriptional regulator, leucine-responsive regulatory protein